MGNIACFNNTAAEAKEYRVFFYHPDHLVSSSLINGLNGDATQHLEYTRTESVQCLPFGETLAEQQNGTSYYSPFKFSAKEKDPETGYSYFGARYYSPELSVWLSIDPMADKRPWLSAYNYCQLNPVMRVDPTGMIDIMIEDFSGGGEGDGNGNPPAKASLPKNAPAAPSRVDGVAVSYNNHNIVNEGQSLEIGSMGTRNGLNLNLNSANQWLGYSGNTEAVFGGAQIGMINYRQSLSLSSKVGTFGRFSYAYSTLGSLRGWAGRAGYLSAGLNMYVDYKLWQSGEIGVNRFRYRSAGTLGSLGTGIVLGLAYGGPWGAIGGAMVSGVSWAGEQMYDGYMDWNRQMSIFLTDFERGINNGWVPGR